MFNFFIRFMSIRHFCVVIGYIVNDVEYKNIKLNYYNTGMNVGDNIQVYCDPQDPSKIISTTNIGYIFTIILSVSASAYAVILPTVILKENRRRKYLLSNGECHRVKIVSLEYNFMEISNAKNEIHRRKIGKYLIAKYNGASFSSEEISMKDNIYPGCTINLYLDKNESKKAKTSRVNKFRKQTGKVGNYYMDINSVEEGNSIDSNNLDA